ncbi:MAG: cobaltochelatase subunit CobN [Alphaproteobacteria bacterium]|nr:cobaltochelatase subunit CobN [Alphaproteobacteria bacterium]
MHLLATIQGSIDDGAAAVDLGQTPGDIVVFSAADTEIAALSDARRALADDGLALPRLRLADLKLLGHPLSVDLYLDTVVTGARLVIARLLGGRGYWTYGVDQLARLCRERGIALALLPGDDQPDAELAALATVDATAAHRLWQYLVHGGRANAVQFLRFAASLLGRETAWREPAPLLRAGTMREASAPATRPVAGIVVYRALVHAADTEPVDALIAALDAEGLDAVPVYVSSLKDKVAAETLRAVFARTSPDVILNATGFAVGDDDPLAGFDCPVLQVVFAGARSDAWAASTRGLAASDIAMNVALTEIDGRVLTRAVAFKDPAGRDPDSEAQIVRLRAQPDRIAFVAALAAAWVKLRRTAPAERRVALLLANYPNRDGRIGNGVGLDTPASTAAILAALGAEGYDIAGAPTEGAALMARLLAGPTNAACGQARGGGTVLTLDEYRQHFATLPQALRDALAARWGTPENDPFFDRATARFVLPLHVFGHVVVGVQPARGYNIDPTATYHDPALVPPHGYLATYAWLRRSFGAHAIVHVGKHGNLEWLPGKAIALSAECWPEAALGPVPHVYPFIVNDPGEGTQAKRRAAAVIVDHLTPPMARAGAHGKQAALERLIDEYHEAATQDPRRAPGVAREIRDLAAASGIASDCGIADGDATPAALAKLDSFLCELKDLQIRDGLHVFGSAPLDAQRAGLTVAIARAPRGSAPAEASLTRALAGDLGLGCDPLFDDLGAPWAGPCPSVLGTAPRTTGDLVDALETLALDLVAGARACDPAWSRTRAVLDWIARDLLPKLDACGPAERAALLAALDGRRVAPGPSGAPTRGRADVLPTGRNFYSVDLRAVPTPAAWQLGWASAQMLVDRHAQEHGDYPAAVALSAWGTSNMRTGGDDIAQGLALMGVRPTWDGASRRVTGFEIIPASLLDRPRVDVTLRVSGFFRDAFPNLIDLFDSAARAVAALDEPPAVNPLAARVRRDTAALAAKGADNAARFAGARVFGSKPGAYGAGLQALIDERGWESQDDLARAYVAWGGHAYGGGLDGVAAHGVFESRLARVQAVIQNQDNREHDILDSDDYYQFEGGLAAAVRAASGQAPVVYHGDHSRPERPRIRTLDEEIARVVRGRAVNPKWIAGVMRHGYKGAFEMAATVDYLFAFAATTGAVADHHFDAVHEAYLDDERVRAFIAGANPAALAEMEARFAEAIARGLWRPRSNRVRAALAKQGAA